MEVYNSKFRSLEAYHRAREAEANKDMFETVVAVGLLGVMAAGLVGVIWLASGDR